MPQKKLAEKKLDYYKKILLKMKEDILQDIKKLSAEAKSDSDTGDVSGHVIHMADVATDMYDKDFNLGLASKEREVLQKIDDALKRIEEGIYGFCLGTGKPISQARLKAIPYAEHSLEHQEELENQNQI